MKKLIIILFCILLISGIAIFYFSKEEDVRVSGVASEPIKVNYTNFAEIISKNSIIAALPSDAVLQLKFYNFDSGERQWEKFYILRKDSVVEGEVEADIVLTLDSSYLDKLTNKNFCDIIKEAKNNGDLGFETSMSMTSLTWKYKSVLKYKSCFGL